MGNLLEILSEHNHSRTRTYPYLSAGISLQGAGANVMGSIVEIIPTATNEINTLTITHACDIAGNVTIDLNGCKFVRHVSVGNINAVAAELRGYSYHNDLGDEFAITGSDATVVFTRLGLSTTGILSNLGTTGVTGTFVKTLTGVGIGRDFDIHSIQVGLVGNSDTYIVTLYRGLAGYEERISSRRFTTSSNGQAGGEVQTQTPYMKAGTRISASLATVGGGNKTAVVSVSYHNY